MFQPTCPPFPDILKRHCPFSERRVFRWERSKDFAIGQKPSFRVVADLFQRAGSRRFQRLPGLAEFLEILDGDGVAWPLAVAPVIQLALDLAGFDPPVNVDMRNVKFLGDLIR